MTHYRDIIPQLGQVSPVDNNTVFLAQYDEHAKDALKGIKPIGNQYSLKFDTGKINCGNSSLFNVTTAMTLEGWVYFTESSIKEMFMKDTSTYEFYQNNQKITFRTNSNNDLTSVASIALNTWTHIAAVYDGTKKYIYINGVLDTSVAYTTPITTSSSPFVIGSYADGRYQYLGRFSNVKLWNRALSVDEVKQSMTQAVALDKAGLMGWWKLDENMGSIAYDYSGNGNDGSFTGCSWAEGSAVYSLNKDGYTGSYGGGVFLEEGTANLQTNGSFDSDFTSWNMNNYVSRTVSTIVETGGFDGGKYLLITAPGMSAIDTAWTLYNSTTITALSNATYTLSWYEKHNFNIASSAHTGWSTSLTFYDSAGTLLRQDYATSLHGNANETWHRNSLTVTSPANTARVVVRMGFDSPNMVDGNYIAIDGIQLEQKAYPTSFSNGTRKATGLYYPASILNPMQGTINCWVYVNPDGPHAASIPWAMAFTITEVVSSPYSEPNQIGLRKWNASTAWKFITTNAGGTTTSYDLGTPSKGWHMFTFAWSGTTGKAYLDGQLKQNIINANLPATFNNAISNAFIVGAWTNQTNCLNSSIDELRIDKVARMDAEILAWYYQGRNGW